MRLLWWLLCVPFRVSGWFVLACCAVLAAFDHDDDPGGDPRSLGAAQKPYPMRPFGVVWSGERWSRRRR